MSTNPLESEKHALQSCKNIAQEFRGTQKYPEYERGREHGDSNELAAASQISPESLPGLTRKIREEHSFQPLPPKPSKIVPLRSWRPKECKSSGLMSDKRSPSPEKSILDVEYESGSEDGEVRQRTATPSPRPIANVPSVAVSSHRNHWASTSEAVQIPGLFPQRTGPDNHRAFKIPGLLYTASDPDADCHPGKATLSLGSA